MLSKNNKRTTWTWSMVLIALVLQSCSMAEPYFNSDPSVKLKSLSDVIKWRMTKDPSPERISIDLSDQWRNLDEDSTHYAVWIGHATYLINNGDLTVLTDPIFSGRASPISWAGPKRLIPPAIPLDELPKIDVIVISHNHYDHLDLPSLKALQNINPEVAIFVPSGDKKLLEGVSLNNVGEFNWWDTRQIRQTDFTFTPVQHWSGRGAMDRNHSWWGGWFMKTPDLSIYHAGDTGYSEDFIGTREKLGAPDVAFIPIGAYSPRWFMKNQHVNPEEAVSVAIDLQVPRSYGMHWGTFILTDEPIEEPRETLARVLSERGLPIDFFTAPKPGEILELQ